MRGSAPLVGLLNCERKSIRGVKEWVLSFICKGLDGAGNTEKCCYSLCTCFYVLRESMSCSGEGGGSVEGEATLFIHV